ncbi:tethering complex subunit PEP3 [Sugiyamaella lignohabitans]|uniref:Tethering complex subunit PEP3 n=1 Tax=Sugiyamaella lignohabitans TaxID=796027 RepID=A0A167FIX9_9ASCO|nr:tethering complex subunit PEP3 [Sugiyamaella lignohabitans]ANB15362.1 tethering complex subunit PEP3 [Sugiyamaella lignohabitans]
MSSFPASQPNGNGRSSEENINGPSFTELDGYKDLSEEPTSLFAIDRVQLMFSLSDISSMVVANNLLCLALRSGQIIRIDLDHPESVDEVNLPRKHSDPTGNNISSIFLDPTGAHLLITNIHGENYYLNYQSVKAKNLGRLKGLVITSVAWNPFEPARSTGDILIGCADGSIYETFIEKSNEYFKRDDRYLRQVWKNPYGDSITGLYAYQERGVAQRQVIVSSHGRIWFWQGKFGLVGDTNGASNRATQSSASSSIDGSSDEMVNGPPTNSGESGGVPVYTRFFETTEPILEAFESPGSYDAFAVSPYKMGVSRETSSTFAAINGVGILHGQLYDKRVSSSSGNANSARTVPSDIFARSQLVIYDQLQSVMSPNTSAIRSITLTEYYIIILCGNTVVSISRLNNKVKFHDKITLEPGETLIGLCSDVKYSTFWAFSNQNIYEIKVGDEEHDIWKILIENKEYEEALKVAKDAVAKDIVSVAYGEHLLKEGKDMKKAASLLGGSSKPFEGIALEFSTKKDFDALNVFLSSRLKLYRGSSGKMQRTLITSWLVELYMEKLDSLDDLIAAGDNSQAVNQQSQEAVKKRPSDKLDLSKPKAINGTDSSPSTTPSDGRRTVRTAFYKFIEDHKSDLDKETVYEIISSHGRREELLYYASSVSDSTFVLNYWIRFEKWTEALQVLRKENDAKLAYKYSTVLLVNSPQDTVDTWIRMDGLDPAKLIPALLAYVSGFRGEPNKNQAIRYLNYAVNILKTKDTAIFNTLICLYASSSTTDESSLMACLETHRNAYDYDFALRVCNQFKRVESSVYIFSVMGLYEEAVKLALKNDDIELACIIADRPANDAVLRKSLWLDIARKVISSKNQKFTAVSILEKSGSALKIEDLLPQFPDFTVMDDVRDEIIASMEDYSSSISRLNKEMEDSLRTCDNVKKEIQEFKKRYALVMPGESCALCSFPVATRRFYVFPCQHAFHLDCLLDSISKSGDQVARSKLADIQINVKKTEVPTAVDGILSEKCVLCSDAKIETVDTPLVSQADKLNNEWAL